MSRARLGVLVLGPMLIVATTVAGAYRFDPRLRAPADPDVARTAALVPEGLPAAAAKDAQTAVPAALGEECGAAAGELRRKLDQDCEVIMRPPFVVGGDMRAEKLEAWYRDTIEPAARALWASFFERRPSRPLTVLLLREEKSYRRYAKEIFGDEQVAYFGYYKPSRRALVMNISTGGGTLVHELTHALMEADFPAVPDWFNEGLASLYEQCRFTADGQGIEGLENWRLPMLKQAIREGRLRPLAELISANDFRGEHEALNYAQARYFCLYMQRQGVLAEFYRLLRDGHGEPKDGLVVVRQVFGGKSVADVDREFRRWVATLKYEGR